MLEMLHDRPDVRMSELIVNASIPLSQRMRGMSMAMTSGALPER
jgi:hypothetical protein